MSTLDAIVIPGGGLQLDATLPAWVVPRFELALERAGPETFLIPLSGGTPHKPTPLDAAGAAVADAVAGAKYLMARGFPPERILPEIASYDTVGNAWFCRIFHVDPRRFTRLLIVTAEFHRRRTEAIFRWVFSLEPRAADYQLSFEATADVGLPPAALEARRGKERVALERLLADTSCCRTVSEFHKWLYSEHRVYAPCRWNSDEPPLASELLATY